MKNLIIALALLTAGSASAAELTKADLIERMQTGRYSHVKNIPPVDQINPLKVVIRTQLPQSIKTVGEAVTYLLTRSGYALANSDVMSIESRKLLNLKIPQIHRKLGPMTLDMALKTLSGKEFELLVDPVNRLVAYELSVKLFKDSNNG